MKCSLVSTSVGETNIYEFNYWIAGQHPQKKEVSAVLLSKMYLFMIDPGG